MFEAVDISAQKERIIYDFKVEVKRTKRETNTTGGPKKKLRKKFRETKDSEHLDLTRVIIGKISRSLNPLNSDK